MDFAIRTEKLSRTYKIRSVKKNEPRKLIALQGVDLQVETGELFGLLGPNGAGKTTLIKILTTLLTPTSGTAYVAGFDVCKDARSIRHHINMVSGGESSGYGLLTVRENLWMFSQFYGVPSKEANRRISEMLATFGIADRINTKSSDLSTGLRQKMNIIRGFLTDPDVLFLDEPTLGLDVGASRDVRNYILKWVEDHPTRTIMLTTHYMVEADELCDRVAIINKGQVLACDSPANLKRRLKQEVIFRLETSPLNGTPIQRFQEIPGVCKLSYTPGDGFAVLEMILEEENVLSGIVNLLTKEDLRILNLQKREPTLEDVFIDLVGRSMAEVESVEEEGD